MDNCDKCGAYVSDGIPCAECKLAQLRERLARVEAAATEVVSRIGEADALYAAGLIASIYRLKSALSPEAKEPTTP
jgi:hypothetical protein